MWGNCERGLAPASTMVAFFFLSSWSAPPTAGVVLPFQKVSLFLYWNLAAAIVL